MKKFSRILTLLIVVSLFTAVKSHAQIEVRIRPERPRNVVITNRPPRPSPRHVWVDEGWKAQGNQYVYRPGYWALPPDARSVWHPGHWRGTAHGSIWIEGHWVK